MANLGEGFYPKLVQIASELGMKPEDILNVMVSESGIDPGAHNSYGGASGLIQFMPGTLKSLKFEGSPEDLRKMSGADQLPLVKKYLQNISSIFGKPLSSPALVYIGIFFPVGLTLSGVRAGDPSTPIVEEAPETFEENGKQYSKKYGKNHILASSESAAYKANPLFHGSTPGAITYGDMLRQVEKNASNPIYKKALDALHALGYSGSAATPSQSKELDMTNSNINIDDLINVMNEKLQTMSSNDKKLFKRYLPSHNILIRVNADSFENELEFSRILCTALDEELGASAYTCSNGSDVEIECSIAGPGELCLDVVKELTESIQDAFSLATKKIGSISVKTLILMNKKSSYQQISWKIADINYRKFLLKFI